MKAGTKGPYDTSDGQSGSFSFDFILKGPGFLRLDVYANPTFGFLNSPSKNSVYLRILPAGQTLSTWQLQAWKALQVNGGVPGDELNRNRQITTLYTTMFNSNPQAFEWAGMAAFASKSAGDGLARINNIYVLGQVGYSVSQLGSSVLGTMKAPDADKLFKDRRVNNFPKS